MILYLVRHAIAFDQDPSSWPDDGDRPLTPEGERRFRLAARGLRRVVPAVQVVLASPFARAWRTAELLVEEARWPEPQASPAMESGRSPTEAIEALRPHVGSEKVAVVGHEPNLGELASTLLAASATQVSIDLKKGGMAALDLTDGLRRGSAVLRLVLTPKVLRSLAR